MTDETSSQYSTEAAVSSEGGQTPPGGDASGQPAEGTGAGVTPDSSAAVAIGGGESPGAGVTPDASATVATRSGESPGIDNQAGDRGTVTTERAGSVAPRRADADRLTIYRRRRNVIVVVLITLFGGSIYLIVRQTSYPGTSASEWFAGDAVAVGLVAAVVALAAAAFAYPTFLEWRDQISGPDLTMRVQYRLADGKHYDDLPEKDAKLTQIKGALNFPVLRIIVDNSEGRVPLRDGRLGIYVQATGNGSGAPYASPKPLNGNAARFVSIADVRYSEDQNEDQKLPATLLTTNCVCPPRSISYFEEGFEFDDKFLNLIIVLTGSDLRAPKTHRYYQVELLK